MSDPGFGTGKQAKGGVKVGVKEKEATKTSPKEKEKFEVEWRVLLHNDDVHTFDYVSRKLAEVRLSFCWWWWCPSHLPFLSLSPLLQARSQSLINPSLLPPFLS
jgi:hypothetical protein